MKQQINNKDIDMLAEKLDEVIREISAQFATDIKQAVKEVDAISFLRAKRQFEWKLQDALDQHNERMHQYHTQLHQNTTPPPLCPGKKA